MRKIWLFKDILVFCSPMFDIARHFDRCAEICMASKLMKCRQFI